MSAELDPRIQGLLDKQALRELLVDYCRGIDRMDLELIGSVFHPDAVDEHGGHVLCGDEIAAGFAALATGMSHMWHFIGNMRIEVDGDRASAETYFLACAIVEREGTSHTRLRAGRYLDRFERREGVWKIAHRVLVDDWSRIDPIGERTEGTTVSIGSATPGDPSYGMLRLG